MNLIKCFFLVTLIFSSIYAFSSQTAKVLIFRGKVTKLDPRGTKATPVKKGDKLLEDTSVVTGDKSFVKIKFADNSTMNLGPNSKIVISKMPEKKANMVNLLTGMIKAEVKKNSNKESKNKMLIKTRSAVMGVRGTKFQTTYNATNKRTALVTIEGKVAMAKQDIKQVTQATANIEEIESVLENSNNTVEVSAGKYSGVSEVSPAADIVSNPTVPVKISPEQYNAIAKTMDSKSTADVVMSGSSADDVAPEGFVNKKEGLVAPKAGGYVDFETGIYVAPLKKAKLETTTGTYTAEAIGTVNKKSGDYIPPQGVIVDPKKGLVINQKEMAKVASTGDQRMLAANIREANQGVEQQGIKVNQIKNKSPKSTGSSWLPKNHLVGVELVPFSESLEVKNNSNGSTTDFYTESAMWVNLSWKQIWSEKIFSSATLGFLSYELNEDKVKIRAENDDEDQKHLSFGVGYKYNDRMTFKSSLNFRDEIYVVPSSDSFGNNFVGERSHSMSYLKFGIDYAVIKWGELDVVLGAALSMGEAEVPGFFGGDQTGELGGLTLETSTYYSFQNNLGLNALLRYETRSVESDDFDFDRSSLGLGFDLVYDI